MLRRMLVVALATLAASPAIAQAGSSIAVTPPAATPPAPGTTPSARAVVIPPDLQALEQKALALQLNSERFSASISVAVPPVVKGPVGGFKHIFGHASGKAAAALLTTALLTVTGEASFVPQEASVQVSFLGLKINARLIGTTLYIEEPFIAREDGGRPWVEEKNKDLEQATGVEPSTLGGEAGSGAKRAFGGTIETLNKARSIQEVGPAIVDGQPTTAFKATVAPLEFGKTTAGQKRTLRKLIKPLASFEVFFAEDGLPVRTQLSLALRGHQGEIITQSDIVAVNVPVVVQPPPADETISQVRLKELLKRRAEKRRRRLRALKHRHSSSSQERRDSGGKSK